MEDDGPSDWMKKRHIILLLGFILVILSTSRLLWMDTFRNQKLVPIQNGQLDLRTWDAQNGDILLLDGEWEFYPSHWLMDDALPYVLDEEAPALIHVPGRWNESLHADQSTPFGFASYRLRMYVDPKKKINYSIRVSSVRSASEIYVNGRLLAQSGRVAQTKDDYVAKNLPYSTSFTADENGVIELVVQVANYIDSRSSGIIRSIKFGAEEAITREMKVSVSMQLLAVAIFLIHSVYALIMFLLGNRERKLLYFSLLALCVALNSTLSNDEKLFHQLIYMGQDWDFRLTNIALIIGAYALLRCTDHHEIPYWKKIFPIHTAASLATAVITLFLTPDQVIKLFPIYYLLVGIAVVVTIIAIFKKVIKDVKGNLLLLSSFLVLIHHFIWLIIWRESGFSIVHYPFDQIISMGCLASVWFKEYFKIHASTKELAATLQRMNNQKDQFLANTSHEFRNPLHGILNLSQTVLNRERHLLQERSIKELETVQSVGQRLTLILDDLIDVMSLQEGNPRLHKKVISIRPIVDGVLDMLHYNAEMKAIKIVNQISEDFPQVIADENRLIQVVFNLVHNAVKFTNKGIVSIRAYTEDEMAYIVVADTGIGMDEDMRKRLFHPYEQASASETMIEGGFGLGLSISKQLVELHGGTFDVYSALGKGSEFTFSLKLADKKAMGEEGLSNSMERSAPYTMPIPEITTSDLQTLKNRTVAETNTILGEKNRDRPRILIVDDDPVNLQVLDSILLPDEYEITMVTSGEEALAQLDTKEWDLVVSDIMMPRMSGYELTRTIRKRFSLTELPILLLTARSQPQDIQSGFLAGANDYVTKPVEAIELKSRIEALTTIKQMVREQLRLEAAWLHAQIQPHFLFNTLNAIIALSEIDHDQMRNVLDELTNFLQHKFMYHNMDELILIEDELNLVRSYLHIEKVRFGDRLQVVWELDEYDDIKVPSLTIQPLVENAIRHGIMKRVRGGKILIKIAVHDSYADISVEDDGVGMDESQLHRILERNVDRDTGVGLINTNQRLKRHFGAGLHIQSEVGAGTKVTFRVRKS